MINSKEKAILCERGFNWVPADGGKGALVSSLDSGLPVVIFHLDKDMEAKDTRREVALNAISLLRASACDLANMSVRFFAYAMGLDNELDIFEVPEWQFKELEGDITYERDTVFANGCRQVCLTVDSGDWPNVDDIETIEQKGLQAND